MSTIGTSLAGSVAGTSQAERAELDAAKKRERPKETRSARPRAADEVVVQVEAIEAVRDLKGNDQEESETDRHSRPRYTSDGHANPDERPHIDVEA